MENVLNNLYILIDKIKDSDDYKKYIILKNKLKENEDIMNKIKRVKYLQKICVNKEYKKIPFKEEDNEIKKIINELESIPIYQEYTYVVEDLNNIITYISDMIEKQINEKLN